MFIAKIEESAQIPLGILCEKRTKQHAIPTGYGLYTFLHRPCKTLIMNKLLGSSCKGQQFPMWIKTKTG